ncbi:CPBP family intramembrane glutamic endopeptidase [Deinococcus fonticola]|uniref:CPBP family intramembrane glutamic endopeptidase n=1 Tax=Deinococcus fonticola TaxID=2528713 RepID=UPI001075474C|nr:type II CAAX endopeptidase family protein [Deinococcus fonticola]
MTTPTPTPPTGPEDPPVQLTPQTRGVRAVDGNRAALLLLVVQNVASALLIRYAGAGLGTALLGSFLITVLLAFLALPGPMRALLADSRWRTPPAWGTALAGFALGFMASRAFALAYLMLVPGAASSVPQFLSKGIDLWVLVLSAGLLIPLAEEVAFRGLMMRGHERAAGFTVAALTSTLAFSIAHGVPASIAGILPLAYVLARIVQHTGSLWNAVIIHALNNTLSVVLGAVLAGNSLGKQNEAMDMLKSEALRLPLAGGALLFGAAVLFVVQQWLTPRPDPQVLDLQMPSAQVSSTRGPWLSAAYVVIVLFGLLAILAGLPAVQAQLTNLRGVLR